MERTGIEISIPIEIAADLNFWISRKDWESMNEAQRKDFISDKVELAYLRLADDCISVDAATTISAMLTGPELGADGYQVSIYDPEAA